MALKVDREKCIGCGACEALCPEGFEIKDGKSAIKNAKAACVDKAIEACPVSAISKK